MTAKELAKDYRQYRGKRKPEWANLWVFPHMKPDPHAEEVFQKLYQNGFQSWAAMNGWDGHSIHLYMMRRARLVQVKYWPLPSEILRKFDFKIAAVRGRVRGHSHRLLKDGKIKKKKCKICKAKGRLVMHHPDPFDPNLVDILCGSCHAKLHGRIPRCKIVLG